LNILEGGLLLAENDKAVEAEIEQVEDIETLQQALAEEKEKAEKYLAKKPGGFC
jgi:hypothetical protein